MLDCGNIVGCPIDKYSLYAQSVQEPAADVRLLREMCLDLKGKAPKVLREDFCGTFQVCCEWVKLGPGYVAHGRDLDPKPVEYGAKHYLPKLTAGQRARVKILLKDVRTPGGPPADLILAMNFACNFLKERAQLKDYFINCFKSLRRGGVLAVDNFGGVGVQKANVETTVHRGFTYYWEQYGFDPVSSTARFAIHFKPKGRGKVKEVFKYDWRLWTLAELRDLLTEAGFRKTHVYWEGGGEGRKRLERVWIALILAEK